MTLGSIAFVIFWCFIAWYVACVKNAILSVIDSVKRGTIRTIYLTLRAVLALLTVREVASLAGFVHCSSLGFTI